MTRVLIIGEHSYLGNSFAEYLRRFSDEYSVRKISVRQSGWREESFQRIDVIYYVAAIVHCKESSVPEEEYYRVNCQLPAEVALKAKKEGVRKFIFVSTMNVYGVLTGCIHEKTLPRPVTLYGKSKLQAEKEISGLSSEHFSVIIIRPPMIYGKDCRGNFARLQKFALRCPVFPVIENKRSVLYIENLNAFVEQIIRYGKSGYYFPQDSQLASTWEMVRLIRNESGKRILGIKLFNPVIRLLRGKCSTLQKIWGSLYYIPELSQADGILYQKYNLSDAIKEMMKQD